MKTGLIFAAAATAALAASAATADTINFSQGASGVTSGGVAYVATDPGNGFSLLTQDFSWAGDFPDAAPVLFDNFAPGAVTFSFASAIASLTGVGIEDNFYGPYSATMSAYDSMGNLVSSDTISFVSSFAPNTIPEWAVSGGGIVTVVITSTNDGAGVGIGPSAVSVPEPAAWTMMLVGFGALGALARRSRRTAAVAA